MSHRSWPTVLVGLLITAVALTGCARAQGDEDSGEKTTIRYGKAQGPYTVLFEEAIIPILEKEGYTFEKTDFSDLLQSDHALNEKEIDVNVEQHTAYLESFNKSYDGHLAAIGSIPTVPAGIFSAERKSVDEIRDGDVVAVPNDAANTARAYALLQKAGWITLDPEADLATVTKADIVENPHNLEIKELVNTTVAATLSDFDYAVITGSIVYNAKIDPSTALLQEDILPHLVLQVAVHEDNKEAKWAKAIVAAYRSDEFKEYIEQHNDGLWWLPDDLK